MLLVLPLDTATCSGVQTFEGTNWTVFWEVNGSNITFGMYGPRDGWIGIGFSEVQGGLQSVSVATPLAVCLHTLIPSAPSCSPYTCEML